MDKAYIVIVSFAFLLLALLHYILGKVSNGRRSRKGAVQQPPSLRAIPFLGHLHLVEKPFHASLWRLAARLGPVYSLRLGSRRAVVVSSSECATECFTEHDVTFANRPRFPAQLLVSFDGTALVTSSYGPHWRNLRRVAAVHLLSTNRVASMSGVIAAEVRAMAHRLCHAAAAAPGGAARVQMKRTLFQLSLSVLMETIAHTKGTRSEADVSMDMSVEAQEFKKVIDRIVPHLGAANMWDYLPVMQWFDVFGVRNKILDAVSRRDAFLRQLIDAVRRRLADGGSDGDKKSMIAVLLTLQKTEPEVYNDTMITALCAAQVALMCMELLQLVEVRIEEVARPLREEVATLKSLLVCVDDSLELAEACTSGGLGLALAQASSLLESTKQKSSVVEEHLYGCVSPRGSPCSLLQPVLSAASKSMGSWLRCCRSHQSFMS
uniref:Uncharacterized protein n=1 Tax=Avena sativa TaxID=4498 RepID=A0ACD6A5B7_AVESA